MGRCLTTLHMGSAPSATEGRQQIEGSIVVMMEASQPPFG